jgi:phage gp16-like protein
VTARPALAKLAIARKELGLDEQTYRAILERLTGHRSATLCSDGQLGLVLDELKAKGWKPQARKPRLVDPPAVRKARALWISLHQLGVVRDRSDAAMAAFGKRQLRAERLEWNDMGQMFKLVEALKAMATRAGWDQAGDLETVKARLAVLIAARRETAA